MQCSAGGMLSVVECLRGNFQALGLTPSTVFLGKARMNLYLQLAQKLMVYFPWNFQRAGPHLMLWGLLNGVGYWYNKPVFPLWFIKLLICMYICVYKCVWCICMCVICICACTYVLCAYICVRVCTEPTELGSHPASLRILLSSPPIVQGLKACMNTSGF